MMRPKSTIAVLCLVATFTIPLVNGCHNAEHQQQRRRRRSESDLPDNSVRVYFRECLNRITVTDGWYWRSVVDYVVKYSDWYRGANTEQCYGVNDNIQCWTNAIQDFLVGGSTSLTPVESCIVSFGDFSETFLTSLTDATEDELEVLAQVSLKNHYGSAADMYASGGHADTSSSCPIRNPHEYNNCMVETLSGTKDTFDVYDYDSVINFMQQESTCESNCQCTSIYSRSSDIVRYYTNKGISCDQCWPTKLAGTFTRDSKLTTVYSAMLRCSSLVSEYYK
ncbi:uncharacterized protein LOC120329070 [Styela clava]